MKKLSKFIKELTIIQWIEIVLASVLTVSLFLGTPVFAWFRSANELETMTMIKQPDNLDIRAGNYDQIINFDLSDIDIEKMLENEDDPTKCYVFSVNAGDYKIPYKLQLAHTTNIPFTYSLYRATKVNAAGDGIVEYHPLDDPNDKTYYQKSGTALTLTTLNANAASTSAYGRVLASMTDTHYSNTYNDTGATPDTPEMYAVPLYLQTADPITPSNDPNNDHDYFILELGWDETEGTSFENWNKAENNKETDIIYITASRTTV